MGFTALRTRCPESTYETNQSQCPFKVAASLNLRGSKFKRWPKQTIILTPALRLEAITDHPPPPISTFPFRSAGTGACLCCLPGGLIHSGCCQAVVAAVVHLSSSSLNSKAPKDTPVNLEFQIYFPCPIVQQPS